MCNNTRLIITYLYRDYIKEYILDERYNNKRRLILRIKLISKKDNYS